MNRLTISTLLGCFVCFCSFGHADIYVYTFNGTLPDGASTHSMVSDGEDWTARILVDSTTPDTNSAVDFGVYEGAIVSGTLEFSGGYSADTFDFSGSEVLILNDVFGADSISARGEFGINNFVFQANNEDLTSLLTEDLVGPGFTLDAFPEPATFEFFQLLFTDEFGTLSYFANQTNNVSFSASAIPEPTCLPVAMLAAALVSRRRR